MLITFGASRTELFQTKLCEKVNSMHWTCLLIGVFILVSCKQVEKEQDGGQKAPNTEAETISLRVQQRPFGETVEFEMQVQNALESLKFADPATVEIDSSDLVLGMHSNGTPIAIPLKYMSAFEVGNFSVDNTHLSITWGPIVGSARIFKGEYDEEKPGFDFGRALNNNNLVIVDRKTRSVWNQLSGKAFHGELQGNKLTPLSTIQSTWEFWKRKHPDTKLLVNRDTSHAVFPESINETPYYNNWKPGDGRPDYKEVHQYETLGLGLELDSSTAYFPFNTLFTSSSPVRYTLDNQEVNIYFDKIGLTAWGRRR